MRIDEWIEACKKLLKAYKENKYPEGDCPLCDLDDLEAEAKMEGFGTCRDCLWLVFDKKHCYNNNVEWPYKARVPRLERWIKRLKEMKEKK